MSLFLRLKAFLLTVAVILASFGFTCNAAEPPVRRRANNEMKIALTFDDGPCKEYTEEILEILDEYGIKATFFEVGENVIYYSDAARRVAAEGHEIGNHTYSHERLIDASEGVVIEEIQKNEIILKNLLGEENIVIK